MRNEHKKLDVRMGSVRRQGLERLWLEEGWCQAGTDKWVARFTWVVLGLGDLNPAWKICISNPRQIAWVV